MEFKEMKKNIDNSEIKLVYTIQIVQLNVFTE